ncbi:MAG: ATP-binding cassette domain-containing protein, partial [Clostridium sp.]
AKNLCEYRRNHIGFVFQNYNLITGYTVLENIMIAARLNGKSDDMNTKEAYILIEKLGIKEKINEPIQNLSGGQKQRVAIARVLINDPQIIFADEPTGALDRNTSNQIMEILKEVAKDKLVVIITHDNKICDWADDVISIVNGSINIVSHKPSINKVENKNSICSRSGNVYILKPGIKNFKVHFIRYLLVSIAIGIGISAFVLSLSSKNIIEHSVKEFKQKNTAFNNGYVKTQDTKEVVNLLSSNKRIKNVYEQHIIKDTSLRFGNVLVKINEKIPMPKATQSMSYGVMPRNGENEIAITPSIARKLDSKIKNLVGKTIILSQNSKNTKVIISGIYNAGYDDFFVSLDIEKSMYKYIKDEKAFSISYDVNDFSDVVAVSSNLKEKGIDTKTAAQQVVSLENNFKNLSRLFILISGIILVMGIFISIILIIKLTNTRFREVGLLGALGYHKTWILSILVVENMVLSSMATIMNLTILIVTAGVSQFGFNMSIMLSTTQIILSVILTFVVIFLVSTIASTKLIKTQVAEALRK